MCLVSATLFPPSQTHLSPAPNPACNPLHAPPCSSSKSGPWCPSTKTWTDSPQLAAYCSPTVRNTRSGSFWPGAESIWSWRSWLSIRSWANCRTWTGSPSGKTASFRSSILRFCSGTCRSSLFGFWLLKGGRKGLGIASL